MKPNLLSKEAPGIFALCLGITLAVAGAPSPGARAEQKRFLAPPEHIKLMSFGYAENLSDGFWLRTLQDADVCERDLDRKIAPHVVDPFEVGEIEHGPSRCKKGWVFHMLDAVTTLSPRFRIPYTSGAVILSVLVDDRDGASALFEKGLVQYPDDWVLNYRAAYHYLFEVGDMRRASQLLVNSARHGGPLWAMSLAARIQTKQGRAALAKPILQEALERAPNDATRARLEARVKEADAALHSRGGENSSLDTENPPAKSPTSSN